MPPHGHSAMHFSVAHIVVSPEMKVVTEGDRDLKSLCLSVNNSAIDVTGCFFNLFSHTTIIKHNPSLPLVLLFASEHTLLFPLSQFPYSDAEWENYNSSCYYCCNSCWSGYKCSVCINSANHHKEEKAKKK